MCEITNIPHLAGLLGTKEFPNILSPLLGDSSGNNVYGSGGSLPVKILLNEHL